MLVVDDNPDTRDLLEFILTRYGARVRTAASAAQAPEAVDQSLPGVLVSDIGMPEEDDYSLTRKVRAREAGRGGHLPALALAAGFPMRLVKPAHPEELARAVATLSQAPG